MEENTVSMVQWRLEVSPSDKDVQGVDVVSAALYLTYTGTNTARDYKVIVTLSIQVKIFSSDIFATLLTLCARTCTGRSCTCTAAACITSPGRGRPTGPAPATRQTCKRCCKILADLQKGADSIAKILKTTYFAHRQTSLSCLAKVHICSREELLTHHLTLVPDNTLTLIARMVFVQERASSVCDHVYTDNFLDGSNSLSSDLSDAFRCSDFTDMTIVCDKREFHCHKFMLAARSEVFAAMLRHEFLEKQNSRVDVKEIDAETMELLLNYVYTGRVSDFKSVSVVELFKVQN